MNIVTLTSINPSFKSQQPLCKMFTNSLLWNITALHRLKYKSCHSWFVNICPEAATRGVLWKKMLLEISQNSQENTCARASFIKKETLAQVFSSEFCEISKNTFFYRTPPLAASHSFSNLRCGFVIELLYFLRAHYSQSFSNGSL